MTKRENDLKKNKRDKKKQHEPLKTGDNFRYFRR